MRSHLETAFEEGCSLPFDGPELKHRHAELVGAYRSLVAALRGDDDRALMHRAGVLEATRLLNRFREPRALGRARRVRPVDPPDIDTLCWVKLLGRSIIRAADDCLPDYPKFPAAQWKRMDAIGQGILLKSLVHQLNIEDSSRPKLLASVPMEGWLRDLLDQRFSRVLPHCYGKQPRGFDEPNCLGKAELVLAFAARVGARAWAITSVAHPRERFLHYYRRALSYCLDLVAAHDTTGRQLRRHFSDCLGDIAPNTAPEYFHLGAVLELCDGSYFVVDPHQRVCGPVPDCWQLRSRIRMLDKYRDVLPGLVLACDDHGRLNEQCEALERQVHQDSEPYEDISRVALASTEAAFFAFAASTEFDRLIGNMKADFRDPLLAILDGSLPVPRTDCPPDHDPRRVYALACLTGRMFQQARYRQKEVPGYNPGPDLWYSEYLPDVLTTIPVAAAKAMKKSYDARLGYGEIIFTRFDIGDPEMLVGRGVLGHLAATQGGQEGVVDALAPLVADRLMLLHAATKPLRKPTQGFRPLSRHAAAVLRALPGHHSTVKDGLRRLGSIPR